MYLITLSLLDITLIKSSVLHSWKIRFNKLQSQRKAAKHFLNHVIQTINNTTTTTKFPPITVCVRFPRLYSTLPRGS